MVFIPPTPPRADQDNVLASEGNCEECSCGFSINEGPLLKTVLKDKLKPEDL